MDPLSSNQTNQSVRPKDGNDAGTAKRFLEGEGTASPEPKRAKTDNEDNPNTGPNKKSHVPGPPGTSDAKQKSQKGKPNEKNKGRRRGTRPQQVEDDPDRPKPPRLPKKQCAVLIGFSGTGYAGMQIQPNGRTIEGVLFEAFVKSGAVSEDNADDPVKISLARAARTDAGVHAGGNVVNMKLITSPPGVDDLTTTVNENLPPEIRVWSILRVQNSFNSRSSCDSRKYAYFFPTYLLIPPRPGSGLFYSLCRQNGEPLAHQFWGFIDQTTSKAAGKISDQVMLAARLEELRRKRAWRIGVTELNALRTAVKRFEGTHNFHNFTVDKDFRDRSNHRHMKSIQVADPVVHGETEWISVLLHGQSFMLHQIRKMMAVLILSVRTGTPPDVIDEMYGPRGVVIPKMPALGLLLEYPVFEAYNRKITAVNQRIDDRNDPEHREPIDFEVHREAIAKFKNEHIYSRMRAIEDKQAVFNAWIHTTDTYTGQDLLYLNHKGKIPPESVVKKGERRTNPFKERKLFNSTDFIDDVATSSTPLLDTGSWEEEEKLDGKQTEEMEG